MSNPASGEGPRRQSQSDDEIIKVMEDWTQEIRSRRINADRQTLMDIVGPLRDMRIVSEVSVIEDPLDPSVINIDVVMNPELEYITLKTVVKPAIESLQDDHLKFKIIMGEQ